MRGACHWPAMGPAVEPVAGALADLEVGDPDRPLVRGATAGTIDGGRGIADALVNGILAPVRWREVQLRLAELGVTHLVEVGPTGHLAGLARRTVPDLDVLTVAEPDDLPRVVETLGSVRVTTSGRHR